MSAYLHPPPISGKFSENGHISANIGRTEKKKLAPKTRNQAEAIAHVFEQIWDKKIFDFFGPPRRSRKIFGRKFFHQKLFISI